jgi:L-threonylcarbamoyladenylate synthase
LKTEIIKVDPQFPDIKDIRRCAKVIRNGGLVIFPTETVYGIAVDMSNEDAVNRLKKIKQRDDGKPFSILVPQRGLISNYTSSSDTAIYKLIDTYWPGPLTLVVPAKGTSETTYGVRMPDHPVALKLIQEAQCSVIAPSANVQDKQPPSTCEEALRDLDGLVDIAIDAGQTRFGAGSTVVDVTSKEVKVLREGVIKEEFIKEAVNKKTILFVCTGNSCRSVMAEYLLKDCFKDNKTNLEISSAGTSVFLRAGASKDTLSVLREDGIEAIEHASQPINTILLKQADLIFVMTAGHRQQVLERVPSVEKRIYLLKEFANIPSDMSGHMDIPDPMGRDYAAYKECKAVIKQAVQKIVDLVK